MQQPSSPAPPRTRRSTPVVARSIAARFLSLGFLALGASCAVDPPAVEDAERCDPDARALRWDVEGLPEPGTPPTWENPITLAPIVGRGLDTHTWMPWDMNDRQAYYLRPGDDGFHIRLRFVVGDDWPNLRAVEFQVALNARLVSFVADGVETARAVVSVGSDHRGEVEIFIPRDAFGEGMNHLHFLPSVDAGERDSELTPTVFAMRGWSITVSRDAPEPATEWTETPGRDVPADPNLGTFSLRYTGTDGRVQFLLLRPERPQIEGSTLHATLRLQRDPEITECDPAVDDTVAVIAILDGEQIPLAGHEQIVATLSADEYREFDVDIELPDSPGRHRLSLYLLPGMGRPARLAGRRRMPPWPVRIRAITDFTWEVPSP